MSCQVCRRYCLKCKPWCPFREWSPPCDKNDIKILQDVFALSKVKEKLASYSTSQRVSILASLIWEAKCWERDVEGPKMFLEKVQTQIQAVTSEFQENLLIKLNLNELYEFKQGGCAACMVRKTKMCNEGVCLLRNYFGKSNLDTYKQVKKLFSLDRLEKMLRGNIEVNKGIVRGMIAEAYLWEMDPIEGPLGAYLKLTDLLGSSPIEEDGNGMMIKQIDALGELERWGQGTNDHMQNIHEIRSSFLRRDSLSSPPHPQIPTRSLQQASSPSPSPSPATAGPFVYHVTSYGVDPTGKRDSTDAILGAISDALKGPTRGFLFEGIVNLGGARVDLDGGNYLISRPLQFPVPGKGNFVIHGGSLTASDDFPNNGYLIDLSPASNNGSEYNYEFVTLRDLFLDSNFRGGGIQVVKSLRISIDNCYITHFNTTGISVQGGHETYIRYSYLGQYITAGGDPRERTFSGTAIVLNGNDNSVTDVVIFSAATGIVITGQANILSGVHCYNKATGFGGTGIYVKTPGLTQTRIVNSYMDFTGIVAEDPVQLSVSSTFFLGDAHIVLKSVKGVVNGVNIMDNMFSGSDKGIDIVQLDQTNGKFNQVNQVFIDNNNVRGMKLKTTVASRQVQGNGSSWTADFNSELVFPDLIKQVQYTFITDGSSFPVHVLRSVSGNKVVIQSNVTVPASVYITADQGGRSS